MIDDRHHRDLVAGAWSAVYEAQAAAERHADARPDGGSHPKEEDLLYWFVEAGLPVLKHHWTPVMARAGLQMQVTGVFCHGTPLARFKADPPAADGKRIVRELGDLLIVHDRHGADPFRRAMISQAKRTSRGVPQAPNAEQERLYVEWPPFELSPRAGPNAFKSGDRDFGGSRNGARYLLIADEGFEPHWDWAFGPGPWALSDPRGRVGLPGSEALPEGLANMLYDVHPARGLVIPRFECGSEPEVGTGQDFALTVHEMMLKTATRPLRTVSRGRRGRRRGSEAWYQDGDATAFMASDAAGAALRELTGPGGDGPTEGSGEEEGRGLAIVVIETGEG